MTILGTGPESILEVGKVLMDNLNVPHLHANEQGVKVLFGKRYRWVRDSRTSPLRLVPAEPEVVEQAIEIPNSLVIRHG